MLFALRMFYGVWFYWGFRVNTRLAIRSEPWESAHLRQRRSRLLSSSKLQPRPIYMSGYVKHCHLLDLMIHDVATTTVTAILIDCNHSVIILITSRLFSVSRRRLIPVSSVLTRKTHRRAGRPRIQTTWCKSSLGDHAARYGHVKGHRCATAADVTGLFTMLSFYCNDSFKQHLQPRPHVYQPVNAPEPYNASIWHCARRYKRPRVY